MKTLLLLSALATLILSNTDCHVTRRYKGRLEIKGMCMNYTIKVLEGKMDTSIIAPTWTDESTNKQHTNVFGLASKCNFPAEIKQGDDFYFVIDNEASQTCVVCMAYYPTPPKKLSIKVVKF